MKQTHPPVICDFNEPPVSPEKGQRFGILDQPTGAWTPHKNGVAEWNGERWIYTDPVEGMVVFNEEEGKAYHYTRGEWRDIE